MARREIISEGKDVAEAIIRGLDELGRRRDQVEVSVLQEPTSGFLGIGGKRAKVKLIEKKWDSEHSTPMKTGLTKRKIKKDNVKNFKHKNRKPRRFERHRVEKTVTPREPKQDETQKLPSMEIQNTIVPTELVPALDEAKRALTDMLLLMGISVNNLKAWWDAKQERILLTFDCSHAALVIGKEGKTLQSIQYVITLIVSRHFNKPISVVVDTQNYWRKLEDKLDRDITYAMNKVFNTKRPFRFRPMSAQMRRYIHRFLADNQELYTISEGEGKWRKVVLKYGKKEEMPKEVKTIDIDDATAHLAPEDTETTNNDTTNNVAEIANQDNVNKEQPCDCVLTAESTNCECATTQTPVSNQASETNTDTKAETQTNTTDKVEEIANQDNVNKEQPCDCVLTAESTNCECATTQTPVSNQASETNTDTKAEEK